MEYLVHDRKLIQPLECDFLIPEAKLAIEINDVGSHYYPEKSKDYHYKKYSRVKERGYFLWTIWQWQLVQNPELIQSMLEAKLHRLPKTVYARQCKIVSVSSKQAREKYDIWHIQGFVPATVHNALVFKEDMVALMSWDIHTGHAELARFATQLHTHVIGGFTKLFKHTAPTAKRLITYSFNDYSDGGLYADHGWYKTGDIRPRYWWVKKNGHEVLSRRSCQKKKIIQRFSLPSEAGLKTEFELMSSLGYVQVYDCGKQRWEYAA